jgi:hypothetical protein
MDRKEKFYTDEFDFPRPVGQHEDVVSQQRKFVGHLSEDGGIWTRVARRSSGPRTSEGNSIQFHNRTVLAISNHRCLYNLTFFKYKI